MKQSKTCSRCAQTKPITEFGIHKKTKDGFYSQCLICRRLARTAYRLRCAENIKIQQRTNYEANRDKRIAYADKRIKDNPERHAFYMAISKKRNHVKIAADSRRRRARMLSNGIYLITKKEVAKLLASSCFYCGSKERMTIDHVIAIARGGTDSIGNIVPACKSCNSRKRELTITEWNKHKKTP